PVVIAHTREKHPAIFIGGDLKLDTARVEMRTMGANYAELAQDGINAFHPHTPN
ncbi:hypothetical protein L914_13722, partial [Phytophthora nicotianae]